MRTGIRSSMEGGMYMDQDTPPPLAEVFEKVRTRENRKSGRAGTRKGKLAEERVLSASFAVCEKADWLFVARPATPSEDADGIDVIVYSTIGKLYIQVKSSYGCARTFRRKRRNCKAIVVIIDPEMSDEKVENKVYDALCRLRRHFMRIRRG